MFATGRYLSIGTAPASPDYDNFHLTIDCIWIKLKISYDDEFYFNSVESAVDKSYAEQVKACNLQFHNVSFSDPNMFGTKITVKFLQMICYCTVQIGKILQ